MDIVDSGGTVHTTFPVANSDVVHMVLRYRRDPGCTSGSGANCQWIEYGCFHNITAAGSMICGTMQDPLTGTLPGGIPVNKAGFTINEINTQTQIDLNAAATVNVKMWKTLIGYHL